MSELNEGGLMHLSPESARVGSFGYIRQLRMQACILTKNRQKADLLVEKVLRKAISEADELSDSSAIESWLARLLRDVWENQDSPSIEGSRRLSSGGTL